MASVSIIFRLNRDNDLPVDKEIVIADEDKGDILCAFDANAAIKHLDFETTLEELGLRKYR